MTLGETAACDAEQQGTSDGQDFFQSMMGGLRARDSLHALPPKVIALSRQLREIVQAEREQDEMRAIDRVDSTSSNEALALMSTQIAALTEAVAISQRHMESLLLASTEQLRQQALQIARLEAAVLAHSANSASAVSLPARAAALSASRTASGLGLLTQAALIRANSGGLK